MMNFPGVIYKDEEVLRKLGIAKQLGKPIDGHAPGLRGDDAKKYFSQGISTDHECFTLEEAEEKLNLGVKILIREGSAAKNFEALIPLAKKWAHQMMFCSDDKHPDDLLKGHINQLVERAIKSGVNTFDALRMASLNPVKHYSLDVGLMREGDTADFIRVEELIGFKVIETYIDGEIVASNGESKISEHKSAVINNFNASNVCAEDLKVILPDSTKKMNVIQVNEGQLVTDWIMRYPKLEGKEVVSDTIQDVLKLVVYNRYQKSKVSIAFIHGFGLKTGAIASSVAHDSHNIIAVGVEEEAIVDAINLIIREKGGVSAVGLEKMGVLALPIAGLMSNKSPEEVARDYEQIDNFSKEILGGTLKAPFMSLSFMALLVIPSLKLSDKGLFDGKKFEFVDLIDSSYAN
jgi:adenine deaminase